MSELLDLTITDAAAAIRSGDLDRAEYGEAWAESGSNDPLNAFITSPAQATVESPVQGGALDGIPVAIKDLFCTEGIQTTAGSRILEGYVPPYTATAVRRIQEAGATLHGKANMDEFAMGSSNENSAFGPVLNPWDHERAPGGSSGGSAAAVAGGLAPAALGTDTGGSIRQPASFCGIVGLKPTYGSISRYGMVAFASSLDQAGPLTRTVADAELLLSVMQGRDPADSTSVGIESGVRMERRESLEGLRFGLPAGVLGEGVEAGVRAAIEASLGRIEALGGEVLEIELPYADYGLSAYYVIAPAEASANLSRFDGVRYGLRVPADDLVSMYEQTRSTGFGPEVKRRIMLGTYALSSGYYDAYYGRALRVRTRIAEDYRQAFQRCDMILTPTAPTVAFKLGERSGDPLAMYLNDLFTAPVSLAGIPAISIPCGLAEPDGGGPKLPVGLQIVGPAFSENRLLGVAQVCEQDFGRPQIRPVAGDAVGHDPADTGGDGDE